jgi:hypothetical protein
MRAKTKPRPLLRERKTAQAEYPATLNSFVVQLRFDEGSEIVFHSREVQVAFIPLLVGVG